MKKRVLSLILAIALCLTLLPAGVFAQDGTTGEGGGIYVPPGGTTEGGGGTYIPGEDTRTEIWRDQTRYLKISRAYDGTADGGTIACTFPFTDGSNEILLTEGEDCTAVKTFDSADAGEHTVAVSLTLTGEAAEKYKLKAGEETFEIGGTINKAAPNLTLTLFKSTCAVGEKLLPFLAIDGVKEDAAVTYYYTQYKQTISDPDLESFNTEIGETTAISELGEAGNSYYIFAKTTETKNFKSALSNIAVLTISEDVRQAVSVVTEDSQLSFASLPEALRAARDGATVRLNEDVTLKARELDDGFTAETALAVSGKHITLDLNGYVLGSDDVPITVKTGAALTVTNAGAEKSEKKIDVGLSLDLLTEKGSAFTCTDGKIRRIRLQSTGEGGYDLKLAEGESHSTFGFLSAEDQTLTVDDVLQANHAGMALHAVNTGSSIQIERSACISQIDAASNAFYVGACSGHKAGADGTCIYCGAAPVASVTTSGGVTTSYASLADALNAAEEGDTVTLLRDAEITKWQPLGKALTLELNGKTVTVQKGAPISVYAKVIVQDSSAAQTGKLYCPAYSDGISRILDVQHGGDLILKSGTFQGEIWARSGLGSALTIEGGTFTKKIALDTMASVSLSGGTFSEIWYWGDSFFNLLADGYAFCKNGSPINLAQVTGNYLYNVQVQPHQHDFSDGVCKTCGYACPHNAWENGVCKTCGCVCPHDSVGTDGVCAGCGMVFTAKVTDAAGNLSYYADGCYPGSENTRSGLDIAFEKAPGGSTVTMLGGSSVVGYLNGGKELTLALNGKSVKSIYVGQESSANRLTVTGTGSIGYVFVYNGNTADFTGWSDKMEQLSVYSGGKATLTGGTFGRVMLNGNAAGSLLASGYAFQYADGSYVSHTATDDLTSTVTVVQCNHGGGNGFAYDSDACPHCGAPAVAGTVLTGVEGNPWRKFADLQTALDAENRDGGAVLRLLRDVSGNYTINGEKTTGLDLNGHSIHGTLYVKAVKGDFLSTTLSNTKNTATASIDQVIAYKNANLAGSGYPAVIGTLTMADTTMWEDILQLPGRLGYKLFGTDGTYRWYTPGQLMGEAQHNVSIGTLPIPSAVLSVTKAADGSAISGRTPVDRGTSALLRAYCNTNAVAANDVTFSITDPEGTYTTLKAAECKRIGTSWYYVADYTFDKIGEYTISFTALRDGYTAQSSAMTLTVAKPDLSRAEIAFPDGNESVFEPYILNIGVPYFTVTYDGKALEQDVDYTVSGNVASDVGTYTLTITAVDGSNYTGQASAEWKVRPFKAAVSVGDIVKAYDGTTDLPANTAIKLVGAEPNYGFFLGKVLPLAEGIDYEVCDARYDSANASEEEKTVSFTVRLLNKGYVFADGTTEKEFTLKGAETDKTFQINKAAAPRDVYAPLVVTNDLEKVYTVDLPALPKLADGCEYGAVSCKVSSTHLTDGYEAAKAELVQEDGTYKLRLSVPRVDLHENTSIGTVYIKVTTENYQDFAITFTVGAKNRITPQADGAVTAADITYGQALQDSAITGRMLDGGKVVAGTFVWADGAVKPDANDSYQAAWRFIPDDTEKYVEVTGTATVKVNRAKTTGEPGYTGITADGKTLADANLTLTGSTLNPSAGTLEWVDAAGNVLPGDTAVEPNERYTWRFTPTNENYTVLTGTLVLYPLRLHTIRASAGAGGSITPSGEVHVRDGGEQTFVIVPDAGYTVSAVRVDGRRIGPVRRYTFTQVTEAHTIEVSFARRSTFVDVRPGSYYEDAVNWAADTGVTTGTDAAHFSPDGVCTRAQAVTFLWRAAGSPAPKSGSMPFTDVPSGAYCYDAVLWAAEQGITRGTSATTFRPGDACTRAQIVTLLWRAEGTPAAGTENPFTDVRTNAFYTNAVLWAVQEGIAKGISATAFRPGDACTRAQIVTFLWRCKA